AAGGWRRYCGFARRPAMRRSRRQWLRDIERLAVVPRDIVMRHARSCGARGGGRRRSCEAQRPCGRGIPPAIESAAECCPTIAPGVQWALRNASRDRVPDRSVGAAGPGAVAGTFRRDAIGSATDGAAEFLVDVLERL